LGLTIFTNQFEPRNCWLVAHSGAKDYKAAADCAVLSFANRGDADTSTSLSAVFFSGLKLQIPYDCFDSKFGKMESGSRALNTYNSAENGRAIETGESLVASGSHK
jgi:hypothetical protein